MRVFPQARFQPFILALMAGYSIAPNALRADELYNTFGSGFTYANTSYSIFDSSIPQLSDYTYGLVAQGFRTPSYVTTFTRATVPFLMENPSTNISPVSVSLFTGEDFVDYGPPVGRLPNYLGQRFADLTQRTVLIGGAPSQPTVFSYTSASPIQLEADSFYWLVCQVTRQPASHARNEWFQSAFTHEYVLTYFVGGNPFGDPYDFDSDKYFASWEYSPDDLGLAMRIEATAVPEPTSITLIAVSTLALIAYRWRLQSVRMRRLGSRLD